MARFRGSVKGQRGEASRLGSKSSGLVVHANGWHTGVTVVLTCDPEAIGDVDMVQVYLTGGSGSFDSILLATWREGEQTVTIAGKQMDLREWIIGRRE